MCTFGKSVGYLVKPNGSTFAFMHKLSNHFTESKVRFSQFIAEGHLDEFKSTNLKELVAHIHATMKVIKTFLQKLNGISVWSFSVRMCE